MKKITLLLLICCYSFYGQTIEVLKTGDTLQKPKYQQFIYLCDSTDLSGSTFVAKIKASGSLKNTSNLYHFIKNKAQSWGANAYRFESFTNNGDATGELTLSAFNCADSIYNLNYKHIPKNKIFVFGKDDLTDTKTQGYKLSGKKYQIGNGQFQAFDIKENEEISITKGGFTGMTRWFRQNEFGNSFYLNFSGLGLNGATAAPGYNGVGISFNTGKIENIDTHLALCLLRIYKEQL
jgi:hypothetical protein